MDSAKVILLATTLLFWYATGASWLLQHVAYPTYKLVNKDGFVPFHIAFGKTVQDVSLNAIANLGYADVRFIAPVYAGDTLRAESEVIGCSDAILASCRAEADQLVGHRVLLVDEHRRVTLHLEVDEPLADQGGPRTELVEGVRLVVPEDVVEQGARVGEVGARRVPRIGVPRGLVRLGSQAGRMRLGNMVDPKYTMGASILKNYLKA